MAKYKAGDTAYIVESNRLVREVKIVNFSAGFYLIRFADNGGGIKVRENRLYATKEEAEATIKIPEEPKPKRKTPYDYMM